MSQENHAEIEQSPQENTSDTDNTVSASISAESEIIISNQQIQSIEISDKFTRQKTSDGWYITFQRPGKVTINLTTSMRKIEVLLIEEDIIENDGTDLIILRKHAPDAYKSKRSGAPLARSREELLQGGTTAV